jgi:hypothetical protein
MAGTMYLLRSHTAIKLSLSPGRMCTSHAQTIWGLLTSHQNHVALIISSGDRFMPLVIALVCGVSTRYYTADDKSAINIFLLQNIT